MSNITILYTHEFASAHRLQGHPGKCAHLHGHNYIITLEIEDTENQDDMVMDFGAVKKFVSEFLDKFYDHAIILQHNDPLYPAIRQVDKNAKFVLYMHRPTAEIMAEVILNDLNISLKQTMGGSYRIVSVTVQESTGQSAKYTRRD